MGNQQGVAVTHKLQNRDQLTTFSQISQELQAKTNELKQKIVNSVGGGSGSAQNSSQKQKSGIALGDNGSGGKSSLYQGIKIENDPLEREIYVKCPACFHRVFDSGLDNTLM